MTVVAVGTSAPDLVVSLSAILEGSSGLTIGNLAGSNITNVILILGATWSLNLVTENLVSNSMDGGVLSGGTILFVGLCLYGDIDFWPVLYCCWLSSLFVWVLLA